MMSRIAVIAALMTTGTLLQAPIEIQQDFRGKQFNDQTFRFEGPNAANFIKREADGLRITLPGDGGPKKPVGFVLRDVLQGDFNLSVAYNLLEADRPTKGYGVGISAYLMLNSPSKDGINFGIFNKEKDGYVFALSHMAKNEKGGRGLKGSKTAPATPAALTGNLRLIRKGPLLTVSASEGNSPQLLDIGQLQIGTEDVGMVRIAADQGNADSQVDVRITNFRLTADRLKSTSSAAVAALSEPANPSTLIGTPAPESASWYWPVLGGAAVLVVVAFSLGLWLATRKRLTTVNGNAAAKSNQTDGP
jgi:hypothetical protein